MYLFEYKSKENWEDGMHAVRWGGLTTLFNGCIRNACKMTNWMNEPWGLMNMYGA